MNIINIIITYCKTTLFTDTGPSPTISDLKKGPLRPTLIPFSLSTLESSSPVLHTQYTNIFVGLDHCRNKQQHVYIIAFYFIVTTIITSHPLDDKACKATSLKQSVSHPMKKNVSCHNGNAGDPCSTLGLGCWRYWHISNWRK
jgi:hypothetical protein